MGSRARLTGRQPAKLRQTCLEAGAAMITTSSVEQILEIDAQLTALPITQYSTRKFARFVLSNVEDLHRVGETTYPNDITEVEEIIEGKKSDMRQGYRWDYVLHDDTQPIGEMGIMFLWHGLSPNGHYWLGAPYQGQGRATRAVSALLQHTFAASEAREVNLNIRMDNGPSQRLAHRVGAVKMRTNEEVRYECWRVSRG